MDPLNTLVLVGTFVILLALGSPIAVGIALSALVALLLTMDFGTASITVAQRMAAGLDLGYVNIVAGMLFGAISGSAVAAVAAVGGFMVPRMKEQGYDQSFGAAVNVSSATTSLIIPPSNILIVYALAAGGVSIAALFVAGYFPGVLVGALLMAVAGTIAKRRGYPVDDRVGLGEIGRRFLAALPSLFLVVVVMGGIIAGWFTARVAG